MKNAMGVGLRILAALIFVLGIIICFFSWEIGGVMILFGMIVWNVGAKLLDPYSYSCEYRNTDVEAKTANVINTVDETIDYSKVPYNLSGEVWIAENRIQAKSDITRMNILLNEACRLGRIAEKLEIRRDEIVWNGNSPSFLSKTPRTKTGKTPKYILEFFFTTRDSEEFDAPDDYFGHIYYMQDGTIGKADLICWVKKEGYHIVIGLIGTSLSVKKIEKLGMGKNEIIYKQMR